MGVKLRARGDKGWYVLIDWRGQRKAKCFGRNRSLAKAFADKFMAKLKWTACFIIKGAIAGITASNATSVSIHPMLRFYKKKLLCVLSACFC